MKHASKNPFKSPGRAVLCALGCVTAFFAFSACTARDFNRKLGLEKKSPSSSAAETAGSPVLGPGDAKSMREHYTVKLPSGAVGVAPVKAKIVSVAQLCPPNVVCIADGTVVKLEFALQSCHSTLGPVSYRFEPQPNDKLELLVSAVEILSNTAAQGNCPSPTMATQELTLIGPVVKKEDINLVDLAP